MGTHTKGQNIIKAKGPQTETHTQIHQVTIRATNQYTFMDAQQQ